MIKIMTILTWLALTGSTAAVLAGDCDEIDGIESICGLAVLDSDA